MYVCFVSLNLVSFYKCIYKYLKKQENLKIFIKKDLPENISTDWFIQSPIDFEHKQYTILSYLQVVDQSFIQKILSPHLLHMEKMVFEMQNFQNSLNDMKGNFEKQRYIYLFKDNPKLQGEKNLLVDEIEEIVGFSIPLLKSKIILGHFILKKNRQLLY